MDRHPDFFETPQVDATLLKSQVEGPRFNTLALGEPCVKMVSQLEVSQHLTAIQDEKSALSLVITGDAEATLRALPANTFQSCVTSPPYWSLRDYDIPGQIGLEESEAYREAHFATFPPNLVEPCIVTSTRPGGLVLDPFFGSGTTGLVALNLRRRFVGIELNPQYVEIAERRLNGAR